MISSLKLWLLLLFLSQSQEEIPFKAEDEFQVKVDLKFKTRGSTYGPNSYANNGERLDKPTTTLLPFLNVNVDQLKIKEDEARIMVIDSKGKTLMKKKTTPVPELHIEMGFVEDLKSNEAANSVNVYFLSKEKKELRRINFSVNREGEFMVNGKWHGKF